MNLLTAWRDVDSSRPRYGLVLSATVASVYLHRRLYRVRWIDR